MDGFLADADVYGRFAALPGDVAGLAIVAVALALDAAIGWVPWLANWRLHPRRWVDPIAGALNAAAARNAGPWTGGGLTLVALTAAVGVGFGISAAARSFPWGWLLELLFIFALLRLFGPPARIARVRRALGEDRRAAAIRSLAGFVDRDLSRVDDHGVGRAAVERSARSYAEDGVGVLFWYGLTGLPGLFAFAAVNRLNARSGFRADGYEDAAFVVRRLAAALNFIPARLAGVLVALATAFAPGGRPLAALRAIPRHARKHRNQAAGWPQAALAGGLDLAFGGTRIYPAEIVNEGWIGDGRARLAPADLQRCAWALTIAGILTALLALLIALGRAATL